MSGRCLGVVWVTLDIVWGGVMCKKQINIQSDSFALAYSFFSQLLWIDRNVPYFGVSEDVCRVSGWCLGGVWGLLDIARVVFMSTKVKKVQAMSSYSATAFSPSGLWRAYNAEQAQIEKSQWPGVILEIGHRSFSIFALFLCGQHRYNTPILIFWLWSFIVPPYREWMGKRHWSTVTPLHLW